MNAIIQDELEVALNIDPLELRLTGGCPLQGVKRFRRVRPACVRMVSRIFVVNYIRSIDLSGDCKCQDCQTR